MIKESKHAEQQLLEIQRAEQRRIARLRRGQIRVANEKERQVDESSVRLLQQKGHSRSQD
jgi:hypothetical protein